VQVTIDARERIHQSDEWPDVGTAARSPRSPPRIMVRGFHRNAGRRIGSNGRKAGFAIDAASLT
jgi:hypothetical protein